MNFNEEAVELAKSIIFDWRDNEDFQAVVAILEDYITDLDTKYRGLLESSQN